MMSDSDPQAGEPDISASFVTEQVDRDVGHAVECSPHADEPRPVRLILQARFGKVTLTLEPERADDLADDLRDTAADARGGKFNE